MNDTTTTASISTASKPVLWLTLERQVCVCKTCHSASTFVFEHVGCHRASRRQALCGCLGGVRSIWHTHWRRTVPLSHQVVDMLCMQRATSHCLLADCVDLELPTILQRIVSVDCFMFNSTLGQFRLHRAFRVSYNTSVNGWFFSIKQDGLVKICFNSTFNTH